MIEITVNVNVRVPQLDELKVMLQALSDALVTDPAKAEELRKALESKRHVLSEAIKPQESKP
jgi:nicotinate-nucleotide pyrophosphorylase